MLVALIADGVICPVLKGLQIGCGQGCDCSIGICQRSDLTRSFLNLTGVGLGCQMIAVQSLYQGCSFFVLGIHTNDIVDGCIAHTQAACILGYRNIQNFFQILGQNVCDFNIVQLALGIRGISIVICGKGASGHIAGEIEPHCDSVTVNQACTVVL